METIYMLAPGNESGGGSTHLVSLAKVISEKFCKYHFIFLLVGRGPLADKLSQINNLNILILEGNLIENIKNIRSIITHDANFSLLHAHGPRMNLMAYLAAYYHHIPWVSTIHSHPSNDYLSNPVKSILYPKVNHWSLSHSRGFFVINDDFRSLFPKKMSFWVPNGLQWNSLKKDKQIYRVQLRQKLKIPLETPLAGIAARLDPVKDIPTVLRALKRSYLSHVHFAIAGEGLHVSTLRSLCEEYGILNRVHFLGHIVHVKEFYLGLDVHILPSLTEGASFSILEAGFVGVPNIGSMTSGTTRLLQHNVTGLCFPIGDDERLANEILRVLEDDGLRQRIVHNFKQQVLPTYTPANMLSAYEKGYDTFIKN